MTFARKFIYKIQQKNLAVQDSNPPPTARLLARPLTDWARR